MTEVKPSKACEHDSSRVFFRTIDPHFRLPPDQQAIRDKCFHPSRTFVEFLEEEVEQSIPERFKLPIQSLFESPTVAEMALIIENSQARMAEIGDIECLVEGLEAISEEQAKRAPSRKWPA